MSERTGALARAVRMLERASDQVEEARLETYDLDELPQAKDVAKAKQQVDIARDQLRKALYQSEEVDRGAQEGADPTS